jgi:NADPH2:quinone reductase
MRALRNISDGGPASLVVDQIEVPRPGPGQVLIEVHAAGVTFPDVLQSRRGYQLRIPLPFTVGCEYAGVVAAVGAGAEFAVGDRVAAIGPSGAFAEYAVAPVGQVFPLPSHLDIGLAAGMPMNVLTADFALYDRGGLRAGETVLVHGAAGGLGIAVIQRAKLEGARVIAVVSTPEKESAARRVGADEAISPDGFLAAVRELTQERGVDMVVDPVGGSRFTDSLRALTTYGRLLVLGFTAGDILEVKVNRLLLNNTSVIGVGWGGLMATGALSPHAQWQRLMPVLQRGELTPLIGATYTLDDGAAAVARLDERRALGKTIIQVRQGG